MSEEQKQELAVWKPTEFVGSDMLPVALGTKKIDTTGRENIAVEDLIFPTLKLLQGSSDEVKKGIEGARAGTFWLTGAEEPIKPPVRLLACAHTKSRTLFPKADKPEHQGLEECRSKDAITGTRYGDCAVCPYKEWDNVNNRPPACSESNNFTVLTPFGAAILRFSRTSYKAGKKLISAWKMSSDPLFAHPLILTTATRTDKVNGQDSLTHLVETKWVQRETVPPHVQEAARAVYEQVTAAHEAGTAPEIWQQMEGRLDAVVCGVGSGGTLTGHGRYFARNKLRKCFVQ